MNYFWTLDLLRIFAALSVVFFHYFSGSLRGEAGALPFYVTHGHLGVELFFLISGFVITKSVTNDIKSYVVRRIVRLYPLFWVACTLTYLTTVFLGGGEHAPFSLYLKNLAIVSDTKIAHLIDGSYWTLTIEVIFYGLIGGFVALFKKERIRSFFIGYFALIVAFHAFGLSNAFFAKLMIVREAPYFIFGGMCALYFDRLRLGLSRNLLPELAIMGSVFPVVSWASDIYSSCTSNCTNTYAIYSSEEKTAVFALIALFTISIAISRIEIPRRYADVTKALGDTTYPLYLLHQKIGMVLIGLVSTYGMIGKWSISVALGMIAVAFFMGKFESRHRRSITAYVDGIFDRSITLIASLLPKYEKTKMSTARR